MAAGMAEKMGGSAITPVVHQVAWYENVGTPGDGSVWKKHVIAAPFDEGFEAVAADLDGDGRMEVIATGWGPHGRVVWFDNAGDPRGAWTAHVIKENWTAANQVVIADFDGDGRPDIAAGSDKKSNQVFWWQMKAAGLTLTGDNYESSLCVARLVLFRTFVPAVLLSAPHFNVSLRLRESFRNRRRKAGCTCAHRVLSLARLSRIAWIALRSGGFRNPGPGCSESLAGHPCHGAEASSR